MCVRTTSVRDINVDVDIKDSYTCSFKQFYRKVQSAATFREFIFTSSPHSW